jgi:hypothetical protein
MQQKLTYLTLLTILTSGAIASPPSQATSLKNLTPNPETLNPQKLIAEANLDQNALVEPINQSINQLVEASQVSEIQIDNQTIYKYYFPNNNYFVISARKNIVAESNISSYVSRVDTSPVRRKVPESSMIFGLFGITAIILNSKVKKQLLA